MILVTGGTGLVGSHLLMELLRNGENVRAFYRKTSDLEKLKKIFRYYGERTAESFSKIGWVEADVLDVFSIEDAMQGITKVYHCAAMVSFDPRDRNLMMKVNAEGTANMINASLDAGMEKFCHVSSTAAIGRKKDAGIINESTQWKNAPENSWYAISKYNAEREVWRGIEEGLNAVIVNPCVIVGPADWTLSSSAMFKTVHDGLKFYTEGGNAFVDVRDVARIMVALMNSDIRAERFLVTGENLKFRELFDLIAEEMGKKKATVKISPFMSSIAWRFEKWLSKLAGRRPRITRESVRAAHASYQYDNSKIKTRLNFQFTPLRESVKHAAGFYLQK